MDSLNKNNNSSDNTINTNEENISNTESVVDVNYKDESLNSNTITNDKEFSNEQNTAYTNVNYKEYNDKKQKKQSGKKRILSYIMVGLLCSTLGGTAASVATFNMMKNSNVSTENINNNTTTNKTVYNNEKEYSENYLSSISGTLTVPDISEKVGPAVVGVSIKGFPQRDMWGSSTAQEGMGSGVIFSEDGYILTNNHVVENAQTIKVIFNNGKEVSAKVVNSAPDYDIAIIKVTEDIKMPAVAEFGDSDDLRVGEPAVAIGNPIGRELLGSVTTGVISAVNRSIDDRNEDLQYIQTDAAINPGNSGGPLLNSKGQVIGINTAKKAGSDIEGLGFAIPINQVKSIIEDKNLMKPRLMIGIGGREVTEDISREYNIPVGIYVKDISDFSAAERAGIRPGDIIVKFDGKKVKTFEDLNKLKEQHESGDTVTVEIVRNDKTIKVEINFGVLN